MTDLQGRNSSVSMTTRQQKSCVLTGGGVCVQGWGRATVRGTGGRCCTETRSWLQQPSTEVREAQRRSRLRPQQRLHTSLSSASEMYGQPDGSLPATFEILYMIGWKPHGSQVRFRRFQRFRRFCRFQMFLSVGQSTSGAAAGSVAFQRWLIVFPGQTGEARLSHGIIWGPVQDELTSRHQPLTDWEDLISTGFFWSSSCCCFPEEKDSAFVHLRPLWKTSH